MRIILTIILLSTAALYSKDNSGLIKRQVEKEKAFVPMKVDKNTTWTEIIGSKNIITYIYKINDFKDADVISSGKNIKKSVLDKLKKFYNSNPNFKVLIDQGINITYLYTNKDDNVILSFSFNPADIK
jgi:hypothetical protein